MSSQRGAVFGLALLAWAFGCATKHVAVPAANPAIVATAATVSALSALRPMLDGKLLVDVPADAVVRENPHDLMSPEPSHRVQDNLWVERDGFRFAVVAREAFFPCDVPVGALGPPEDGVAEAKIATSHPEVLAVLLAREPPRRTGNTTHLGIARICLPDTTMTTLTFVTDLDPAADLSVAIGLRDRILVSVTPGPGRATLRAHEETLNGTGAETFRIRVPESYLLYREKGDDFVVYRVHDVDKVGTSTASGLIYFGEHPEAIPPGQSTVPGIFLGETIGWSQPEPGQLCYLKSISGHYIDVVLRSQDPTKLATLKSMMESIERR